MASKPSRQGRKQPALTDETPRTGTAGASIADLASSLLSVPSESTAMESQQSRHTQRSTSPSKRFPLYGPEKHTLVRALLFDGAATALDPALRLLVDDINDVARCYGVIPRRVKAALERRLSRAASSDRLRDYMFYDDQTWPDSAGGHSLQDAASDEELVRRASRVFDRSRGCSLLLSDESAWNHLVHTPLLDMLVCDMQDAPGQDVLDILPCMTTNIEPTYHRFASPTSRVDYVCRFLPQLRARATQAQGLNPLNWTTDPQLRQYPLAFSIETKRHGGDMVKGEQQLAIWQAAQWEFLTSRVGADAVEKLAFLPGIVVQGKTWSLFVTTRQQATTAIMDCGEFGNTDSIVGVFQVLAGLRRLRSWSLDVLLPWYNQYLPGLTSGTA